MAERNWARITSGATFEELATTVVFFEDPRAALFGRRGKDGGQDARSGDGTRVFQAKHHENGSSAKAIADAKKEAAKIAEYRAPDHERSTQWQGVTDWRLVTNAAFNPTDHQRWLDEVVPLFEAQGLRADYWERAHLDALLDRNPEVSRAFFGGEPRAFLSLPELGERQLAEQPFLTRASSPQLRGRDEELARIRDFLASPNLFLVIHGAGGIGKTRLLTESGSLALVAGWQVLSANLATMAATGSWFDAIVPERPTVLLVDEPNDEQVLRLLSEQLGGRVGRTAKWKVVLAVRSPKDPVLRFLSSPKLTARVQWLPIDRLQREAAVAICDELIRTGPLASRAPEWRSDVATRLADQFSRHPIWLALAVQLLESHGDIRRIPGDASALADSYLTEVIGQHTGQEPETIRDLLRWIALLGTVNRENEASVRLVADGSGVGDPTGALGLIAQLVQRRALIQRGANDRLVELKPDVLRDHVLRGWLVVSVGYGSTPLRASVDAAALLKNCTDAIAQGGLSPIGRSILVSVARTELLFRLDDQPVALLDPFFDTIRQALPGLRASARIAVSEVLVDVAPFRVSDTIALVRELRTSVAPDESLETMFGRRDIGNDDVILELGWAVYHAAIGAQTVEERTGVLGELQALAEVEAAIGARRRRGLPNDGKRAASLIGRALQGGPQFWSDFDDAVEGLALRLLRALRSVRPSRPQIEGLRAVVLPTLALERQQTWFEDNHFILQKYAITEEHAGWGVRATILATVRELLEDNAVSLESRVVLWGVLVESHRLANYAALNGPETLQAPIRVAFLDELEWAYDVLRRRGPDIEEMKAARDMWEWHIRYEKDTLVKAAAQTLEDLYTSDDLAKEFEPLMAFLDTVAETVARADEKAAQLVTGGDGAIDAFIERSIRFLRDERRFSMLLSIANQLGARADGEPSPRNFVTATLKSPEVPQKVEFALRMAARWFQDRRIKSPDDALALVEELLATCCDDKIRIRVLLELYGTAPPSVRGEALSAREVAFIRSQGEMFEREAQTPQFVGLVSWTLQRDWDEYRRLIEGTLLSLVEPARTEAVAALMDGVFYTVYKRDRSEFPPGLNRWLLDQVLRVSDFDDLNSMLEWRLGELIKVLGKVPLDWLPGALKQRAALEATDSKTVSALSHDMILSEYVETIEEVQRTDPGTGVLVDRLVELADDRGTVGYRLADVLHRIDPNGYVVATRLAEWIQRTSVDEIGRLARLGRAYVVETPAWRTIAAAVLRHAATVESADERRRLYRAIAEPGVRSWSGTPGEVPSVFVNAVERARSYRDRETDVLLRPFWEWYVSIAESELRDQEEHAREERGE